MKKHGYGRESYEGDIDKMLEVFIEECHKKRIKYDYNTLRATLRATLLWYCYRNDDDYWFISVYVYIMEHTIHVGEDEHIHDIEDAIKNIDENMKPILRPIKTERRYDDPIQFINECINKIKNNESLLDHEYDRLIEDLDYLHQLMMGISNALTKINDKLSVLGGIIYEHQELTKNIVRVVKLVFDNIVNVNVNDNSNDLHKRLIYSLEIIHAENPIDHNEEYVGFSQGDTVFTKYPTIIDYASRISDELRKISIFINKINKSINPHQIGGRKYRLVR